MGWRDQLIPIWAEGFRQHVRDLDEAERAQRTQTEPLGPARRNLPEGPGQRAARRLQQPEDTEQPEERG